VPTFGRLRVLTLPRLIDTRLVEKKEEGHMGRERGRQARGGGQGRERHDRERGGGFEDRPGDPSDPSDPGEAMPEHEFRHRIREHLARIDERLERIDERLGRLER
jgi:hypothetical protein